MTAWALDPRGFFNRWQRPAELRIDVELPGEQVHNDLHRLGRRLRTPGDALHGIATLPVPLRGLVLRHREADGEHYVYAQDTGLQRLAGYTVFNRLIELDRRADRVLRSPHTKIAPEYRRHGIASAVYGWALEQGMCLISGPRQSPGAHALWRSLGRRHPLRFVRLQDKRLTLLGDAVSGAVLEDFHTRMVLWGRGWNEERFGAAVGAMPHRAAPCARPAHPPIRVCDCSRMYCGK